VHDTNMTSKVQQRLPAIPGPSPQPMGVPLVAHRRCEAAPDACRSRPPAEAHSLTQPTALAPMWALFAVVRDPRRPYPTKRHPLEMLLAITMLATRCGVQHGWRAPTGARPQRRVCAVRDPPHLHQAWVAWRQAWAERV